MGDGRGQSARNGWRSSFLACALAVPLLASCGGSGGADAGEISIASGQTPDPVVVDVPVVYVTRPVTAAGTSDDARDLLAAEPGAQLLVRERAAPSAFETDLTPMLGEGAFDIRDLEVSHDGERLLFSVRGPLEMPLDDADGPSWNIWTHDLATGETRRVIASDTIAEAGQDRMATWLPDGRILFTSTRQRRNRAVLLDEGKPQFAALDEAQREPAFVLHVMRDDGSDIRQISFSQNLDRDPVVAPDGKVVFARRDRSAGTDGLHLYRMNPDGTELELLYGAESHATGTEGGEVQFLRPRVADDGLVVLLRPTVSEDGGGDLVRLDVDGWVEAAQPLANAPGGADAQLPVTINEVRTDTGRSPGGRYRDGWPLADGSGRLFVTWSLCRLRDPEGRLVPCSEATLADERFETAPPLFGLFLYDPVDETQIPVVAPTEGVVYSEVVAAEKRLEPLVRLDGETVMDADPRFADAGTGLLAIRSVYDVDGVDTAPDGIATLADPALRSASERPARFLRVSKAVSIPDDEVRDIDGSAFGRGGRRAGMREIVGYAPIEPDGSVVVQVPADVSLALSVLDGDGRRIGPRHRVWLQLRPGETLACNGCHDPDGEFSHGRGGAFEAAHAGAPVTGSPYPNTRGELFADAGETMAEIRKRLSCATDCASTVPSMDLVFEDPWTEPDAAGRAPDAPFALRHADLATPAPVTAECQQSWSAFCRSVIHYEAHIHPLWSLPRLTLDPADDLTVLADDTCTGCHSPEDAAGAVRVPEGDLDLTDGPSAADPDHFAAYRELLYPREAREVADGVLQVLLVETGIDPETGEPILEPVRLPPPMNAGRAASAGRFLDRFAAGGSHAGRLSDAELRLLVEWMDIGAQYFNDPFAAPEA